MAKAKHNQPARTARMHDVATVRAASDLLARAGLATKAGLTFAGKRDTYAALGYPQDISVAEYRKRYRRGGVARRIVTAMPKATWRGGGELVEDENLEVTTAFEQAWDDLNQRLRIWPTLVRLDILAGIGRYAVLLIGAPGDLTQEMPRINSADVVYLQPFGEDDAKVHRLVTDMASPRFGLPLEYRVSRLDPTSKGRTVLVHWSRVIHWADDILDDEVYADPRLEAVWNLLDDLDKVRGGGSEAFWLRAHQGYQFDIDPEVEIVAGSAQETALKEEVDEFMHGMRRSLRTQGMKVKTLGSDVANFGPNAGAILDEISATTGIPKRILMGSERGELSSTQDKTNWDERVTDRRTENVGPRLVRQLVDRLIEYGALPTPRKYEVRWPQVQNLTEAERADIATKYAEVNDKQGETVVTTAEIRDRVLGLPPLEEVEDDGGEDDTDGVGAGAGGGGGAGDDENSGGGDEGGAAVDE